MSKSTKALPRWTKENEKLLLYIKKINPEASYEAISSVLIGKKKYSPEACKQHYYSFEIKNEEEADFMLQIPLTLAECRKVVRMREPKKLPPSPWNDVADAVGHDIQDCKDYYMYYMTKKRTECEDREANLEQEDEEPEVHIEQEQPRNILATPPPEPNSSGPSSEDSASKNKN